MVLPSFLRGSGFNLVFLAPTKRSARLCQVNLESRLRLFLKASKLDESLDFRFLSIVK